MRLSTVFLPTCALGAMITYRERKGVRAVVESDEGKGVR
jgi:hypothetical protein